MKEQKKNVKYGNISVEVFEIIFFVFLILILLILISQNSKWALRARD